LGLPAAGATRLAEDPLRPIVVARYALKVTTALDGFHLALTTKLGRLDLLETGLRELERRQPPLARVAFRFAVADPTLVVLLAFADTQHAARALPASQAVAATLGTPLINLTSLDEAGRAQVLRSLDRLPLRTESTCDVCKATNEVRRLTAPAPLLRLDFEDLDQLYTNWASAIAEGGLWVPSARAPHSDIFRVDFHVEGQRFEGSTGTVLAEKGRLRHGNPGFWIALAPSDDLQGLFNRRARERRQGRPSDGPPPGVVRQAPRFDTMLEVRFDDMKSLAAQWATDISHGGMFICCSDPPELRARVNLHLNLPEAGETTIAAEVVHRILSTGRPGVGVQFLPGQEAALAPLIALLDEYQRRQPRVLVVDDEAIWRSTLSRALSGLGCDVQLASDGNEGLLKLIEGYFDLDLVILDLHMPNLDGRGLIERVRQQGGDIGLKMFLFSAAGPEELRSLAEPGLATGVFSKLDSIDVLTARIAHELGLPLPGLHSPRAA
jgi:CheY-like chemotaxis protein/Tfp pilus assembly protein PilZ